LGLWNIYNNYN